MNDLTTDIIITHEGLIYSIINKYKNIYDIEDLHQVAIIGLMKAINKYDKSFNTKFSTYAYKYILGDVLKYINDNRSFKLSKEYLQLEKKIIKAREILTQKMMRKPSNSELSIFLEIDEQIINQIDIITTKFESLESIIYKDSKNLTLLDTIKDDKSNKIDNIYLYQELDKLDETERSLLQNRFFLDRTQQETAKILGINQVQVSRNEKKILKKLKSNLQVNV